MSAARETFAATFYRLDAESLSIMQHLLADTAYDECALDVSRWREGLCDVLPYDPNLDPYMMLAARIYDVTPDQVNKGQRNTAKTAFCKCELGLAGK